MNQFEDQNVHEVYFRSYIDLAKEDQISWDKFVTLMDKFTPTMSKCKLLISILLTEIKTYKDSKANEANREIIIKDVSNTKQTNENVKNKEIEQQNGGDDIIELKTVVKAKTSNRVRSLWECKPCSKSFLTQHHFVNHQCEKLIDRLKLDFQCQTCGRKGFNSREARQTHIIQAHARFIPMNEKNILKCDICEKSFYPYSLRQLKTHYKIIHSYTCS